MLLSKEIIDILIVTIVSINIAIFLLIVVIFFINEHVRTSIKNFFRKFKKQKIDFLESKNFARQLAGVLIRLSHDVIGGLIVVEKKSNLNDYVNLGYAVRARFSSEFVANIFYNKASPLHDGGIIVREFEIISVSSYFPVTKTNLDTNYGARHRAAIGVTEISDAIAFVVSETTAKISYCQNGKLESLSQSVDKLTIQIYELLTLNKISNRGTNEVIINNTLEEK